MPPKVESIETLIAKRDIAIASLDELYEEFNLLYQVEPELIALENVQKEIAIKYRSVKKQQSTIAERLIESGETEDGKMSTNKQVGDKVKTDYLKCTERFVVYQKKWNADKKSTDEHEKLDAMTFAVTKMADALSTQKNVNHGLEKLSVPNWDGSRKNYATWKNEFNYWMEKYNQDKDERLQRFRKALPKNSFWSNQVSPCKTIDQAWKILDTEFGDQRKLMDLLLKEITNHKRVRRDSFSLSRYAATILGFVNNMEQNGCAVTNAKEAPFATSQLLSKLDTRDNIEFGREMRRMGKEENIQNLIDWLNSEASLRSRVGKDADVCDNPGDHRIPHKSDNRVIHNEMSDDDACPLGCEASHVLSACPEYLQAADERRWEIVKQNNRCRKCLRKHHTNVCKQPDGTTCDKCTRRHHRTLHSEQFVPAKFSLNPQAAPYENSMQGASNLSMQGTRNVPGHWAETQISTHNIQQTSNVPGHCPVQKVKIKDKDGNFVEALAMLDSGSNTSFISKNVTKKLGLSGPKVRLTMNLAGGQKKSEESELVNITVVPISEETIQKPMQVYAINKPCSSAKTVSRKMVNSYPHLEAISNKLYISGGSVDLLIGADFADAFVDIHVIPGGPGEPIAKRNCFGWYVMGHFSDREDESCALNSAVTSNTLAKASEAQYLEAAKEFSTHVYVDDEKRVNQERQGLSVNAAGSSGHSIDSLIAQKSETSDDRTPSQTKVSGAMEIPPPQTSFSTVVRQTSELPVLEETENTYVKNKPEIDEKQSVREPLSHQSLLPADLSTTSEFELAPSVKQDTSSQITGPQDTKVESRKAEKTIQPTVNDDLIDSIRPLSVLPLASPGSLAPTAASSDANLDATTLSKAQQAATFSASTTTAVSSGEHKESNSVPPSSKIKVSKQNVNTSTQYMEELHQKDEVVINGQRKHITKLQSKLNNLTKARMDPLYKEMMNRHVIGLHFFKVVLIVVLFLMLVGRNSNHNAPVTPREHTHLMNDKDFPNLAIKDGRNNDITFQSMVSVSGTEHILRYFKKPPAPEQEERVNARHLLRSTEKRVQEFWDCRIKYFAPNSFPSYVGYMTRENLTEKEIVVGMEPTPRRTWKLGLVLLTYPGADGLVRKARIKTATSVYDRPIHKL